VSTRRTTSASQATRRLAILESDWFMGYNHSVRPFFEGISGTVYNSPDVYHYERFVGRQSIEEAMRHLVKKRQVRYLYLASHGEKTYIKCPNKDRVSRVAFDQILQQAIAGSRLDGLYFASCLFGTRKTAELLWSVGETVPRSQRLKWVAGYTREVDWMESMALDWLFWSTLLTKELRTPRDNPVMRVQQVVSYLVRMAPDLCRSLQFHVYVRKTGTGEIADLVADGLSARGVTP
jgi:hypothetical protein